MAIISPGFFGKSTNEQLPPGQYLVRDWPVLTYGPTPDVPTESWSLEIGGLVEQPSSWNWQQFQRLPKQDWTTDIHCVTRWSKLGTIWQGVWLDELLNQAKPKPPASHLLIECHGGYSTNLKLAEVVGQKAMVAYEFNGQPLPKEHGGPARLLVPKYYFWKSAKWLQKITLLDHEELGFWEQNGYHAHGDPWKEERYAGD